jgi:hypothetical protein
MFLRDAHVLPKLLAEEYCRRDVQAHGRLITIYLSVSAVNPLVALRHPWKKERGAILLFILFIYTINSVELL